MPVKLERELKRRAQKKDIEDKDAYVYGTLRKTGWKPRREREKKMSAVLDDLIKFKAGIVAAPYRAIADPQGNVHSISYRAEPEPGIGGHLKRHAGLYTGGIAGAAGLAAATAATHGHAFKPSMLRAGPFQAPFRLGAALEKEIKRDNLKIAAIAGGGVGGLVGAGIDYNRRKSALAEGAAQRALPDRARIMELLKKSRKSNGSMVPGDTPGASAMLSTKLDHLIEFSDPELLAAMKKYPYLRGHAERLGLVSHGAPAWHVSAPSSQVTAAMSPHIPSPHPYVKPAELPGKIVQPDDILNVPDPATAAAAGHRVMGHENRLSLLNQLAKIRERNAGRQAALRESQRLARPGPGAAPDRYDIARGLSNEMPTVEFARGDQFVKSIGNTKIHPLLRNAMGMHLRDTQRPGSSLFALPDLAKDSIDAKEAARLLSYRRNPALSKKHINSPWPGVPGYQHYSPFPQLSAKLDDLLEFARGDYLQKAAHTVTGEAEGLPKKALLERIADDYTPESFHRNIRLAKLREGPKEHFPQKGIFHGVKRTLEIPRKGLAQSYAAHLIKPKLFSAKLDDLIEFADPRPRNPLGEFTGSSEGVPDPNTMHKTYNPSYSQVAGTAAVGGAAGAMGVGAGSALVAKLKEMAKKRKAKL